MNARTGPRNVESAAVPERLAPQISSAFTAAPLDGPVYETRRWLYLLSMPLSWSLTLWVMAKKKLRSWSGKPRPVTNTVWFDGLSPSCRMIRAGAASWKALDIIYNYRFGSGPGLSGRVDDFWLGMMNAQAVRNRLKLAKQELRQAILSFSGQNEVRVLSLAAGSAQGVIETVAELKACGVGIQVMLLDIDSGALVYAQELAHRHGVEKQVAVVKAPVSQVVKVSRTFRPHIIEMLGLLDYISQDKAVRLATRIQTALEPNGIFLTCNIRSNPERHFLKWVIDWSMIYRTPDELKSVLTTAGFRDCRLVYEPLGVHGLAIACKD